MKKSAKHELVNINDLDDIGQLYQKVSKPYWLIGQDIVIEEQNGSQRAEYGTFLVRALSKRLTAQYGNGFSISTLKDMRKFFLIYQDHRPIGHAVHDLFVSKAI